MREQVSSLLESLQRQTSRLQEATAMTATGEAASSDGLAPVHVNAVGIVTDVAEGPDPHAAGTDHPAGFAQPARERRLG